MDNNFRTTINWLNADVHFPEQSNEPIIYCTSNNKIGVFKDTNNWKFLKDKYHIKWWCYQYYIIPEHK